MSVNAEEMSPEYEAQIRVQVKIELRKRMKAVRGQLTDAVRAQRSIAIAQHVTSLPEWQHAQAILSFMPMRKEPNALALSEAAWSAQKRVAIPRVDDETGELTLHWHTPTSALRESDYGVPEPLFDAEKAPYSEIDLVIVPGLAFDERGHRIGYGRGYYDRLLAHMPHAFTVGIGYDFQFMMELPNTPNDVPLSMIATDARLVRVAKAS